MIAKVGILSARVLVCSASLAAIVWGLYVIPLFWRPLNLERVAQDIIQGDTFQGDEITSLASTLDVGREESYPSAFRSVAIIQLRALEKAMAGGVSLSLDEDLRNLHVAILRSLSNAPADPFLWTLRFWLENMRNGFSRSHLRYLQMSYRLGPNEGWVAVKRNRLALAIFSHLPADLQDKVVNEYAGLVRSNFADQAADILVGPGWSIRSRLLSKLRSVPQIERERLADVLYSAGYDISIPGVDPPASRPWR